ncbi:hypothetical protein Bpfe_020659, partial [Biomphalaria pfeifferi]
MTFKHPAGEVTPSQGNMAMNTNVIEAASSSRSHSSHTTRSKLSFNRFTDPATKNSSFGR